MLGLYGGLYWDTGKENGNDYLGLRVLSLGFKVEGLRFEGLGFNVWGALGFEVCCLGRLRFRAWGLGFNRIM